MPHDPAAVEKAKKRKADENLPHDEAYVRSLGWIEYRGWLYSQFNGDASYDYQGDPPQVWIGEHTCLAWLKTRRQFRRFHQALKCEDDV